MAEESALDPLIGAEVGNYRVERLLGKGGMGRVYEAVQPAIQARVAIKVIANRDVGDDDTARFFSEARAVNLIRHERIVNVIDMTSLPDGRPCIVMEYIDGCTLEQAIEHGGKLPIGTVLRTMSEVVSALGAAHERNIVHRDLKPGNIFITPGGHAKLVDFGIAKLLSEPGGHQTEQGVVVGTVPYMSPEQALGQDLDGRSDLFAVGVVLFEALTGLRPFQTENIFALSDAHAHGPASARSLRPELPEVVDGLIRQALTLDRDTRFASAEAMMAAIEVACRALPESEFAPIAVHDIARLAAEHAATQSATVTAATAAAVPKAKAPAAPTAAPTSVRVADADATPPLHVAPAKATARWPWLVGAAVALAATIAALSLVRTSGREAEPDGQPAALASDASPAPLANRPLRTELGRDEGPIDIYAFTEQAKALVEEHLPDAGILEMTAFGVSEDGLVRERAVVELVATGQDARQRFPCRAAIRAEGKSLTIELSGARPEDCPSPVGTPSCPMAKLHGIFAAAAGAGGNLTARYDGRLWRLSTDDGEMSLDDGLCANQ